MATKDKMYEACKMRSTHLNKLKKEAIDAGNRYFSLYDISRNVNVSVSKVVE